MTLRNVKQKDLAFQSTHPVWDATSPRRRARGRCWHFNPRIPYGMRPLLVSGVDTVTSFQSTHPVWDATWARPWTRCPRSISIHASRMGCDVLVLLLGDALPISIHASRMGCDPPSMRRIRAGNRFQSTHPVWDATARMDIAFHNMEIIARSSS